jgi:hypothetical protein
MLQAVAVVAVLLPTMLAAAAAVLADYLLEQHL